MVKQLTAYVIAPLGSQTQHVMVALRDMGVLPWDRYSFQQGDSVSASFVDRMDKVDFVVARLATASPQMLYEVGVAIGAKKPIAMICSPQVQLPASLAGTVTLRTTGGESGFAVFAFLARFVEDLRALGAKTPQGPQKSKEQPGHLGKGSLATYLRRVQKLRKEGSPAGLEALVMDLLRKATGTIVQAEGSTGPDSGVDAMLWNDALDPTLGNPVLVSVKWGPLHRQSAQLLGSHLKAQLRATQARTALLIYLDPTGWRLPTTQLRDPHILHFDMEDLLRDLKDSSFEEVLLAARNRIAHGEAS